MYSPSFLSFPGLSVCLGRVQLWNIRDLSPFFYICAEMHELGFPLIKVRGPPKTQLLFGRAKAVSLPHSLTQLTPLVFLPTTPQSLCTHGVF